MPPANTAAQWTIEAFVTDLADPASEATSRFIFLIEAGGGAAVRFFHGQGAGWKPTGLYDYVGDSHKDQHYSCSTQTAA